RARGDKVKFISVTNGDKGHFAEEYKTDPSKLAERRLNEARAAAAVIGAEFETLDVHDGEVYITPELTERVVRAIRRCGPVGQGPDLVVTNRPNDYHRDHRYTARLVLDATYMLTVPLFCPDVPHLARMPVFAYWFDRFSEGGMFEPDVVIGIDDVLDKKVMMAAAHASQVFEWLPYNAGYLDQVPSDSNERIAWLAERVRQRNARVMGQCRNAAAAVRAAAGAQCAEAFQISEYGRQPSAEELRRLFPV
ncbi:MAG: PIG-L family deacetylase, partial [Abditibacteriales bacterium]|nr:PIG-L family deacetylase [Abditibacteriales bacterium]MDW8368201.1 PIG-L family deacetylase [Abditibacteriales bacterium]